MSKYEKQANKFLKDTGTSFKTKFLEFNKYFPADKDKRDIYLITLKRGEREYSFKFGTSINDTERKIKPSVYSVLACLQKYEVGTLEDFCADFGYSEDSIKAEKTYKAVLEEYNNLKMLYSSAELEKMQEIV